MARIRRLDETTANQIAAGEVVERPASVLKELIENAVDAGAARIAVRIAHGGKTLLRIEDDGSGIEREDVALAFERHATSKLESARDLAAVRTMGFRGEALPSIASVARLSLVTLARGEREGTRIELEGGRRTAFEPVAAAPGTVIEVRDLFYNVPARLKFLKTTGAETAASTAVFTRQALAHPEIHFTFTSGAREEWSLPRARSIRERAAQLLGDERARRWIEVVRESPGIRLEALIEPPDRHHPTRGEQQLFVNLRPVVDRGLQFALFRAYEGLLPQGRFPAVLLFLDIAAGQVDVNVHPAKTEIRLADAQGVQTLVVHALRDALAGSGFVPELGARPHAEGVREAREGYLGSQPAGSGSGAPVHIHHIRPAFPLAARGVANPSLWPSAASGAPGSTRPAMSSCDAGDSEPGSAGAVHASGAASSTFAPPTPAEPPGLRVLGQFRATFVVASDARGLVLVDQHTAHERVLFEQLERAEGEPGAAQRLLLPVVVELTPPESAVLAASLPELARLGLEIDPMGGSAFALRTLPAAVSPAAAPRLLKACIASLAEGGAVEAWDRARARVLATIACHAAVKRNMPLATAEMERLVADVLACRDPYRCPHGRAILLRFDDEAIQRSFGRYW